MSLSDMRNSRLVGGCPKIVIDGQTANSNGSWLLSGKMIVEFKPSPGAAKGLEIEVPFSDAANEREAIQQAVEHLQQICDEIGKVASQLSSLSR